jgi:hypothetical protein
MPIDPAPQVYDDNQGAIKVDKNAGINKRSKHVDTKHHFIKTKPVAKAISLNYAATKYMKAEVLKKPVHHIKTHTHSTFSACKILSLPTTGGCRTISWLHIRIQSPGTI